MSGSDVKQKQNQKRLHLLYGTVILILAFAFVLTNFFNLTGISHTKQLSNFSENLSKINSPPKTFSNGSFAEVGHVANVNGDSCDYIAGEMYETDLSKEEIMKYYSNISLPSVTGKGKVSIDLLFYEKKSINGRLMYQIQIYDSSLPSGFDIRCI